MKGFKGILMALGGALMAGCSALPSLTSLPSMDGDGFVNHGRYGGVAPQNMICNRVKKNLTICKDAP